jgi:hypothetical protein
MTEAASAIIVLGLVVYVWMIQLMRRSVVAGARRGCPIRG